VIPALPSQFQLPGAELFATPGLPSVKPAPVAERSLPLAVPLAIEAPPSALQPEAVDVGPAPKIDTVGPTIPASADRQALLLRTVATSDSNRPAPRTSVKKYSRLAILGAVAVAFTVGIAMRRCTSRVEKLPNAMRTDVALVVPEQDASPIADAATTITSGDASALDADIDAAAMAADASFGQDLLDAGPAKPVAKAAPVRTFVKRSAASKSTGKVSKSRGKTTTNRTR
jgi:hypothetical protein